MKALPIVFPIKQFLCAASYACGVLLAACALAMTALPAKAAEEEATMPRLESTTPLDLSVGVEAEPPPLQHIRVALLLPLTAQRAGWRDAARAMHEAAQMALFDSAEAELELVAYDTKGTEEGAIKAARQARREGAEVLVGPVLSEETRAILSERAGLPTLSFSSNLEGIDEEDQAKNIYLLGFSVTQEVERVLSFASEKKLSRIAAFLPRTPYGVEVRKIFLEAAEKSDISISAIETYDADFRSAFDPARRLANYTLRGQRLEIERARLRRVLFEEKQKKEGRKKAIIALERRQGNIDALLLDEEEEPFGKAAGAGLVPPPTQIEWLEGERDIEGEDIIGPLLPEDIGRILWRKKRVALLEKEKAEEEKKIVKIVPLLSEDRSEAEKAEEALENLDLFESFGPFPYDAILIAEGGVRLKSVAQILPHFDITQRDVRFLGTGLWDDPEIVEQMPLHGGWFAATPLKERKLFEERFEKIYGGKPHRLASIAYDAIRILAEIAGAPREEMALHLSRQEGFRGVDGLIRLRERALAERSFSVLEVRKHETIMLQKAPKALP